MISKEELIRVLPLANDYTEVKIPKKRGGWRTLLIPPPELLKTQRKILRSLKKLWDVYYENIHGLRSGSYVSHAKFHSDSRFIFKLDLKDAFHSVDLFELKIILYKKLTSMNAWKMGVKLEEVKELTELIMKLTTVGNTLPQGASTSPFLFWLAIKDLFIKLEAICDTSWEAIMYGQCELFDLPGWKVSCYVDGFVISGPKPLPSEIKEKIFKTVEEFGFKVNTRKIHQFDCRHGAPLITGIRVNGKGRISLPKKITREWRGIIYRIAHQIEDASRIDDDLMEKIRKL